MILLGKGIPLEKQLWFQDSYTQLATLIVNVHNIIWYFATFIAVFVAWILTLAVIDGYMDCNYFSSVAWNKGKDAKIVDWSALDVNFTQPKGVLHLLFFSLLPSFLYIKFCALFNTSVAKQIDLKYSYKKKEVETSLRFKHGDLLEFLWLIGPCLILILIALPSFCILQALKADYIALATIKVIGNQWYWVYESWEEMLVIPFPDYYIFSIDNNYVDAYLNILPVHKTICCDVYTLPFDSYMILDGELDFGSYRLLDVDYPLDVQVKHTYECYITSQDVLHSWAIPSLGIKVDAVPGRLNAIYMYILQPGIYYGQCSELCGVNHGFMPIAVRARVALG